MEQSKQHRTRPTERQLDRSRLRSSRSAGWPHRSCRRYGRGVDLTQQRCNEERRHLDGQDQEVRHGPRDGNTLYTLKASKMACGRRATRSGPLSCCPRA